MINWKRTLGLGALGLVATALAWCLLRAFTGIFEILNLRVFIGVIALMPAIIAPIFGSDPTILTSRDDVKIPKAVAAVAAAGGIAAILLGEFAASTVTGLPIPWTKFNLICLLICAVLPFQADRIFGKR